MDPQPLPPLLYRCPVCEGEVAVVASMIGETVRCPEETCGQPIFVDPPRAEFIGVAPTKRPKGKPKPALAKRAVADAERQLLLLRPSMWRNSPLRFFGTWAGVVVAVGFAVTGLGNQDPGLTIVSAACALLLLVVLGTWWLSVLATSLIVTTRRTTLRRGIFEKNTNEVQHDDVRNIQVDQDVIDRLLGVGTLKISSSGQDDLEIVIEGIEHPAKIAETIRGNQ